MTNQVIHGDCMDVLAEIEDNCIDTIITDPPYHLGSISKRFTKTSLGDDNDTAANARNGSNQYARLSTGFMGARWDGGGIAFQPELWAEMLRVAKPGATLLAFGGTRTHHRLMVAIEDAGWEIRDCISHFHTADSREADLLDSMTDDQRQAYLELHYPNQLVHYLYGSGFPKGHDISKFIDRKNGAIREDAVKGGHIGYNVNAGDASNENEHKLPHVIGKGELARGTPVSDEAKFWQGWNVALKPAYEPIILAMKPIESTYANNAQVWGVAGLNIDGSRISTQDDLSGGQYSGTERQNGAVYGDHRNLSPEQYKQPSGRWPANVLMSHSENCVYRGEKQVRGDKRDGSIVPSPARSWGNQSKEGIAHQGYADSNGLETVSDWICVEDCAVRLLDEQAGVRKSQSSAKGGTSNNKVYGKFAEAIKYECGYNDSGSASRFFYTAKAPNREKWFFCQLCQAAYPNKERDNHGHDIPRDQRKHIVAHPTVKPLEILKYLCKLTRTPTGGIVLDPFAGSGTTGLACIETGRDFILIEKEADYYEIAKARVEAAMNEPRQAELF